MKTFSWKKLEKYPKDICFCRCGHVFLSHSHTTTKNRELVLETQEECPGCKSCNDCYRVSSRSELVVIREENKK